ncbi:DUF1349 domain-containing protein [Vibrio rotiferianus]|uniref:DUF1349 domain-containing protein n=1 Tax=Vibrio rotiferianus TaxID=190895 RepID=UPI00406A7BB3
MLKQDFTWVNPPKSHELDETNLKVKPYGKTDFIRSYNSTISDNASFYFSETDGDFCIQVELNCELKRKYDAGALHLNKSSS